MNHHDADFLADVAKQAMVDRGLEPDYPPDALKQLASIASPAKENGLEDLRELAWCSIDNDDSRDLDQLTWAEQKGNVSRVLVAVADVDAVVKKDTPLDGHAHTNTTSVYTAAKIFAMLPEKLSTNLTSLNENEERIAVIFEMMVDDGGNVTDSRVYRALVRNQAKLAYDAVAQWLDGKGAAPANIAKVRGLEETLRLQDRVADKMRSLRHEHGALDLETIEAKAIMSDGKIVDLRQDARNNARMLIEDFMIASNGVSARFLEQRKFSSIRRVVRSPERWDRIEKIASDLGERLPADPDAPALEAFLVRQRKKDPTHFPDLSLAVVKAMGPGEYVLEKPGEQPIGHFGLAVKDYAHSTAPNRRYPDIITHRLLKAAMANGKTPYNDAELASLAEHCTRQEDAANKVERQVRKSAAALLLQDRVGEKFDAIVTGASAKGTWVRIMKPPVEGKVVHGEEGLDIGEKTRVKLVHADPERGFIDFVRAGNH
ncbi:MAG TPA: RNB domain-containing ribonuclease [Thermoanaerobaculia bacterium]|nr:RNB domain-containing ribonuclease [Thermoanaerobaculia bacterium]